MSDNLSPDPFTTESLIALPEIESQKSQIWHGFILNSNLQPSLLKLADPVRAKLHSLRPDTLQLDLDDVPLPPIDSSEPSSPASSNQKTFEGNSTGMSLDGEEDIWTQPDVQKAKRDMRLISWDHFLDATHEPARPIYISEGGSLAFDALLRKATNDQKDSTGLKYAKPDILRNALFDVALGRGSRFFEWDSTCEQFKRNDDRYTVSGVSLELLDQIISQFLQHGAQFRRLKMFRQPKSRQTTPFAALTSLIHDVLHCVEQFLEGKKNLVLNLLQLKEVFSKPFEIIDLMFSILEVFVQPVGFGQKLQNFFDLAETVANGNIELGVIVNNLVGRVLHPVLEAIACEVGISTTLTNPDNEARNEFVQILPQGVVCLTESSRASRSILQQTDLSSLLQLERLARKQSIVLCHSWDEVCQRQNEVTKYEEIASEFLTQGGTDVEKFADDAAATPLAGGEDREAEEENVFSFKADFLDKSFHSGGLLAHAHNSTQLLVRSFLDGTSQPYSWAQVSNRQALELSLLPIVTTQHRLLSYVALQSLFTENHLRLHLSSLQRFHLMNDGPFVARLSTSLFDANQSSNGGKRNTNLTSGLRLQERDTWPPASSELRLVLMGILTESMASIQNDAVVAATSFAIRDLPDDELERCRDLNSIYALDFLRLHYKASSPILESVITPKALKRYDRIFMHLLRLLRLKDLSQHLFRQTCTRHGTRQYSWTERRLRREMHHFVNAIANNAQTIAIQTHWHTFDAKLQAIQDQLDRKDYKGTLSLASSLDHVREMHEHTLNNISQALLLRKKQSKARAIIEDIFGMILRYAASSANTDPSTGDQRSSSNEHTNEMKMQELSEVYTGFSTQIVALITYLSAEADTVHSGEAEDDNVNHAQMAHQLALAIDYNGYYAKNRRS